MKKSVSKICLSLLVSSIPAMAYAWGTAGSPSTIYSKPYEVEQLMSARTPDGKTYVSWIQLSERGWSWGYDLYLQLLDEEGNPMWDEETLAVETRLNTSWTDEYSLVVTPDGDAIVSWADARSEEEGKEEWEEAYGQEPVIYRINQDHQYVWGQDGITFSDEYMFPPILYVFGNDIYAILKSSNDYDSSQIVKLNDDGTLASEPKDFASVLTPSEGTDFIAVYTDSEGTVAMRYDSDLNPIWDKAAVVSQYIYGGFENNPYSICPDGQGGIAITFARELDYSYLPIVNHISADGEATFGKSVDVVPEDKIAADYDYPIISVNPDSETIFTVWSGSGSGTQNLGAQLFDFFGERMLPEEGITLADKADPSGYAYGPIAVYPLKNDTWFVCYADEISWDESVLHFASYDKNGNELWNVEANSPCYISNPSTSFEDGLFTLICLDNNSSIWTIQYDMTVNNVGINQISNSGKADITEIYSVNGTRLNQPVKGINIIRRADGSTEKIIVK